MYFAWEPNERRLVWSYLWKEIDYANFDIYYLPTGKVEKLFLKNFRSETKTMCQYILIELVCFGNILSSPQARGDVWHLK